MNLEKIKDKYKILLQRDDLPLTKAMQYLIEQVEQLQAEGERWKKKAFAIVHNKVGDELTYAARAEKAEAEVEQLKEERRRIQDMPYWLLRAEKSEAELAKIKAAGGIAAYWRERTEELETRLGVDKPKYTPEELDTDPGNKYGARHP